MPAAEPGTAHAGGAADAAGAPPPASGSAAPRWPAGSFFRWEEGAGPRDVWDALPFPPGGPGVFGRLLAAAAGSSLFRGRGEGDGPSLALSAVLSVGGFALPAPLRDDEDVEKAVQLWRRSPGTAGVIVITLQEGGASAASIPRSGGAAGSREPSLGASRQPRTAPAVTAALGNAFPVDAWACVLNAVACGRCGAVWVLPPLPSPVRPRIHDLARLAASRPGMPPRWPARVPTPRRRTGRAAGPAPCAPSAAGPCWSLSTAPST